MSTLEKTTVAPTFALPDAPLAAAAPALARPQRDEVFVAMGRAVVVLVPAIAISLLWQRSAFGMIEAGGQAAIWLIALTSAFNAAWLSMLVVGIPTAAALGTLTGLGIVTLLEFWLPGSELRPWQFLLTGVAVFAGAAAFEKLVTMKFPGRRSVVIVGASMGGGELAQELLRQPGLPFRCLGVVCDDGEAEAVPAGLILGRPDELSGIVRAAQPDIIVLAGSDGRAASVTSLVESAAVGFRLVGVPEFYEHAFGRVPVDYLSPTWFMSVLHLYQRPYPRVAKRLLDVFLASVGLLLAAPLFPVIAVLVRRSGPGPILFRQPRLGEGGATFEILKFRTMRDNAEEPGTPQWAAEGDPRVTPIGRFLRRTRLDELPQLWNVLRGDMSFVGPRPERPEFLALLESEVPYWTRRLLIKPGITGWAQVRRGYAADVGGTAEKLSYDLYYLRHRSLILDLAITVKTVRIVCSGEGAH